MFRFAHQCIVTKLVGILNKERKNMICSKKIKF